MKKSENEQEKVNCSEYPDNLEQIKKETRRVKKLYSKLPKADRDLLNPLISKFAFMEIELEDWQRKAAETDDVMEQRHILASYTSIMKSYTQVWKELKERLPKDVGVSKLSKLLSDD